MTADGERTFVVPERAEVSRSYLRELRKRLKLTEGDGVSDERFYDA